MESQYTKNVMERFLHPKNFGEIKDADIVGEAGNIRCGDVMHLYIKLNGERIQEIKFKTLGCAAAIATSDVLCDLAKGKTLSEAGKITNEDIVKKLGGLPTVKLHCSVLAVGALKDAIRKFEKKN